MPDDLVARLRTHGDDFRAADGDLSTVLHAAADEIERLRAENGALREGLTDFVARDAIARAALGHTIKPPIAPAGGDYRHYHDLRGSKCPCQQSKPARERKLHCERCSADGDAIPNPNGPCPAYKENKDA